MVSSTLIRRFYAPTENQTMKILTRAFALLFAAASLADDIMTTDGQIFKDATITKNDTAGVVIAHSDGIARVPYDKLPEELRKKFNYELKQSPESKAPIQPRQAAQTSEQQKPAEPEVNSAGHAIGAPLKQLVEVYGEPKAKEHVYLYPTTSILTTFVDNPPRDTNPLWIMPEVIAMRFKPKKGVTVLAYIRNDRCVEIDYTWTATSIGDPSTLHYDGLTTIVEGLKELNKGQSSWSRRYDLSDLLSSLPYERSRKFTDYISGIKQMRDDLAVGLHDPFSDDKSASVTFWLLSWREYLADFDRQATEKKEALQKKRGAEFTKGL